jgi:hypothetical protein
MPCSSNIRPCICSMHIQFKILVLVQSEGTFYILSLYRNVCLNGRVQWFLYLVSWRCAKRSVLAILYVKECNVHGAIVSYLVALRTFIKRVWLLRCTSLQAFPSLHDLWCDTFLAICRDNPDLNDSSLYATWRTLWNESSRHCSSSPTPCCLNNERSYRPVTNDLVQKNGALVDVGGAAGWCVGCMTKRTPLRLYTKLSPLIVFDNQRIDVRYLWWTFTGPRSWLAYYHLRSLLK